MGARDFIEYLTRHSARSQWKPGDESDSVAFAVVHHVVPLSIGKAVAILHRDDRNNLARPLDVLARDIR